MFFQATFRKLVARAGASTSESTGNCLAQDDTVLVDATSTYTPPDVRPVQDDLCAANSCFSVENVPSSCLLVENVLVYMTSYVARKVMLTVSCVECRCALVGEPTKGDEKTHCLLTLKNQGGLLVPSKGLIRVITVSESCLRALTGTRKLSHSASRLRLQSEVVGILGLEDVFCLRDHIAETSSGINNHGLSLIRIAVGRFFDARIHHIARLQMSDLQDVSMRQKNTRSVIFLGQ